MNWKTLKRGITYLLFISFEIYLFSVSGYLICPYVCAPQACLVTEEVGRKRRRPGTGVMDGVSHHGDAENRTRSRKYEPIL